MNTEYGLRRKILAETLSGNSIAIIPAAHETVRNNDCHYPFRQDSYFYYLTGFNEPDSLLVITSGADSESILFNPRKDPLKEQWTGIRLGQEDAPKQLGISKAYSIEEVDTKLPELMAGKQAIYYLPGRYHTWDQRIFHAWSTVKGKRKSGTQTPEVFQDVEPFLSEMRLFKSDAELKLMRKAANISVEAHQCAMRAVSSLQYEYELEAELLYTFKKYGCDAPAYNSIVASGKNACILHYVQNNQPLHKGDLVLIDAGGEYSNYASDITRVFPVNGKFSPEQKAIYELVQEAQAAAIQIIKPGVAWNLMQDTIVHILTRGLVDLGILTGRVESLIEQNAHQPFYMHQSGHWLGLDVHDCGAYQKDNQWRTLQSRMVLTVEPGLYLPPDDPAIDPKWRGIAVRIEDDILVTEDGYENLSGALPVAVDEIEALVRD